MTRDADPNLLRASLIGSAVAAIEAASNPYVAALAGGAGVFASRFLECNQERRVAQVVGTAAELVVEFEAAGERLRSDRFADAVDGRSSAEEVIEGVLLAARDTPEERKLHHLGHLLARLAFDEYVGPIQALHLVKSASSLSYDQYRLMETIHRRKALGLSTKPLVDESPRRAWDPALTLLADAWELYSAGYVRCEGGTGLWLTAHQLIPGRAELVGTGALLRRLLGLAEIEDDELEAIAYPLRKDSSQAIVFG